MSVDAIYSKRERRQWEPEEKAWNDDALYIPWEDIEPPLHSTTIFSLKNIFFFSHATSIQASVLKNVSLPSNSALIEAPTGSGKTLAFLLPLMERTIRMGEAAALSSGRPPLTRRILGVIFSPSRALAEQTYVVGKRLAARFPFNINFALCDGVIETGTTAVQHLKKCKRGIGSYLVTTPQDFQAFLTALVVDEQKEDSDTEEQLTEQDERTRLRYIEKKERQKQSGEEKEKVMFFSSDEHRFLVIVDEADLVFQYEKMKQTVMDFVDSTLLTVQDPPKKRKRETENQKVSMDFLFVGATVSVSSELKDFFLRVCHSARSHPHILNIEGSTDFLGQLTNQYMVCHSPNFLPLLVLLMNHHPGKKHFIFFNSSRTLLFIKELFHRLSESTRPLLFVKNVFTMHEGMTEAARIQQYNSFLTHNANEVRRKEKPANNETRGKNQHFTGGWKRRGTSRPGPGAVLLCTDIAAFGLDVRDVDYVYHFEPPTSVKTYVHRIGRVGRMGMRGVSILLFPCCLATDNLADTPRERKTTSNRFNTATNTKLSTAHLQKIEASLEDLPEGRKSYVKRLSRRIHLDEHAVPASAPISSTLRNIIREDSKLLSLARKAAMSMCRETEDEVCWFNPRLAIECLLLNE